LSNKNLTIVSLILIILALTGFVLYNEVLIPKIQEKEAEAYQLGIQSVIWEQTQTGNIYYYEDEEIKSISLDELKGGINNE